jgi:transcription termination factor NusB
MNWGIYQLSRVQYKVLNLSNWEIDQLSSVVKKNILKNGFEFKSKKIKNWGIDQLSRVQYKILKIKNWGIDQLSRVQYKILKLRNWGIDQFSSVVKKKYSKKLIRILITKIKELRNWPIVKGTI